MISERPFGSARLFTLQNSKGMTVQITNYGGIITSIQVPSKSGQPLDVALGFSTLDEYPKDPLRPYFGAIIGRYGNRIAEGKFSLEGKTYSLAINNHSNHLHGGKMGFDQVLWEPSLTEENSIPTLKLFYLSKDGEENYPGNLSVSVIYRLLESNTLEIEYHATCDQSTPLNLTNHTYFNLEGEGHPSVLDHQLQFFADHYTPVNSKIIPTGEIASVQGTPFDFLQPKSIGEEIESTHPQIQIGNGYDHNLVLSQEKDPTGLFKAARVFAPVSGIIMDVSTTEPAFQFYTANFLDGKQPGKQGKPYPARSAFCIETQHYPDSPNQPAFPNTILRPGEIYQSKTQYRFSL
ncbi:MAG: aldose epimerase family protein [Verrucomicrobiota bacterium]